MAAATLSWSAKRSFEEQEQPFLPSIKLRTFSIVERGDKEGGRERERERAIDRQSSNSANLRPEVGTRNSEKTREDSNREVMDQRMLEIQTTLDLIVEAVGV